MAKNLLLIMLAGLFLGCSLSAGSKFNSAAVKSIDVGHTTESDVIAMMGQPLSETKLSNGIHVYNYAYGHRCLLLGSGVTINSAQVQCYNGVATYKWHMVNEY